ncbi:alpha/beta hydrolase [Methylopila sp. M107]|uniref:alpha/beta fold hydrolase n=1 Tax=Methylopila sp. M107 TaxID=1101190 RepID=UPI00035C1915|nr:alpha/beta hydrolase [Methylopila sp. M107]
MSPADQKPEQEGRFWTEPSFVEVDGLATAYRRKGAGDIVLFLHGAGMTRTWLPIYESLSKSFDTLVPEHPGFGDTPRPDTLEGFDDLVLHYDALIRELKLDKPIHLVGHSLGGWIAASLAVFYPERFASVTLLQPMGILLPEAPSADPFRWSPEETGEILFSGAGANYGEYFEGGDPVENAVREYEESITFARLTWNPRYDWKFDHRLARVTIPVSAVGFADDRYIPVAQIRRWAELIPGAEFVLLSGANGEPASHLANVQQPDKIAEIVKQTASRAKR